MSVLELRDVEVVYHRRGQPPSRAVAGVSLAVERAQIMGLVGESGCGKSTLGRVAVGLQTPTQGTVLFEGEPLLPISRHKREPHARRLQMVFQNPNSSLNPRRRIGNQIADALKIARELPKQHHSARVVELLDRVGLPPSVAERYPHEFSGGQKQRIAIARALAADPSMIVLDEPLSSLDASGQALLANQLSTLSKEFDIGLLLISHDLGIVRQIADAVTVMYLGKLVEQQPTSNLWEEPLHPYAEALLAAMPEADGEGNLPTALPGEVPDPARPPSGCRFHPRCPRVLERCSSDEPAFFELGGDRRVACWLREESARPSSDPDADVPAPAGA
jgi:peptide/nickel transport system ATP-binding protein